MHANGISTSTAMLQRVLLGVEFVPPHTGKEVYESKCNHELKDSENNSNRAQFDGERYDSCQ